MEEPLNDVAVPVAPPDKAIVLAVWRLVAELAFPINPLAVTLPLVHMPVPMAVFVTPASTKRAW